MAFGAISPKSAKIVNIFSYYNISKERYKICKPRFQENNETYISVAIESDPNPEVVWTVFIILLWVVFIIFGILEIMLCENFSDKPHAISYLPLPSDKIGLLLAAGIFTIVVGYLSNERFANTNFCLMNLNDAKCNFKDISCFRNSMMPIQAVDFDFGIFVRTKTESEKITEGIG